jgi:phosphoenolpyruvate-protein kinase (PTS system EI component)
MPVSDLLQRLRPVGAPGAAGPVAVPIHAEDVLAAELEPLFDALEPVAAECETIRSSAAASAAEEAAAAQRDTERLIADATSRAPAERAAAAARIRQAADAAADAMTADAEGAAVRLTDVGRERLGDLTDLVITHLRATITAGGRPTARDSR